jgi:hypothetical protein
MNYNTDILKEDTLKLIEKYKNTYLERALYSFLLSPVNMNNINDDVLKLLDYLEIFYDDNNLSYNYIPTDGTNGEPEILEKLTDAEIEIENSSKERFWTSIENNLYEEISNFNCFEDKIVKEEDVYKVCLNDPFYNIEGWINYYNHLLDTKLGSFEKILQNGKTQIRYKHFQNDYFIGIEVNYSKTIKEMKHGDWETPYFNMIRFKLNEKFKLKEKSNFGLLGHPYFHPPAYNFGGYFAIKTVNRVSPMEWVINRGTDREFIGNGMIRLYNSEKFGEDLKRHAFYYFDMLSKTTNDYINSLLKMNLFE